MSKEIDLTKPLSEFDLKYLVDRQRWADIRQNAANLDLPEPNLPSARGLRAQVPRSQLRGTDDYNAIAAQLKVKLSDESEGADTAPAQEQGAETGGAVDYTKLTVPQLREEMDKRRQQYESDGDTEGVELMTYASDARKDDLVSALKLDDEEDDGADK
jgi:hypothetical protein